MILDIAEIKKIECVSDLLHNFDDVTCNFSCKVNKEEYPYPRVGEILDEEKSVRWNREQVEALRNNYELKVQELRNKKNELLVGIETQLKNVLAKQYHFTQTEMEILWSHAYEEGHSSGISEVFSYFDTYANMYIDLLCARNSGLK